MKIKLTSAIQIDELNKRISKLSKNKNKTFEDQLQLSKLKQLQKEYEYSGELFHTAETDTNFDIIKFKKVLTSQRLQLLSTIKNKHFASIGSLASYVNRDIKNIYDDLKILEQFALVKLNKSSKSTTIVLNVEKIILDI